MRKRLVNGKWVEVDTLNKIHRKEDLTVDGYINKYGGIKSQVDGEVYTSKRSYMEHLKQNNCVIKDWK
jgi:hypothetical protein